MKKNVFVVGMTVMVLTFALALASCSSAPFVYDETVPPEQSSTLIIKDCQVNKFNGTTVSAGKWSAGVGEKTVIIPAGKHTLDVWGSASSGGGTTLEYGNVEMTYNFLPGKTYLLIAPIASGTVQGRIYETTALNSELVPNPDSPNATPLEGKWVNTKDAGHYWIFANDECVLVMNGQNLLRGFFTYNERRININYLFMYFPQRSRWNPIGREMNRDFAYKENVIVYDEKNQMKKAE